MILLPRICLKFQWQAKYFSEFSLLWEGYPHTMLLGTKVFFLAHIATTLGSTVYETVLAVCLVIA